jgi:long-chain acyl-CoA synthetase
MRIVDRARFATASDLTLGTLLERLAEIHGDRRLVEEHGSDLQLTYREGADRVARYAGGIAKQIEKGEKVVVGAENGYEFFLLCLAVSRAGGIAVPVNPKMSEAEIAYVTDNSGAALVVKTGSEVEGEPLTEAVPADPGAVAAIFYTSGTTGKPKGAELTHRALLGSATRTALLPLGPGNEMVCGMPVAHIAGFTVLLMAACMGVPLYLLPKFRPDTALDAIESRRSTVYIGVPATYRMMLEAGAADRDLRSIRLWASGADAMPPDMVQAFKGFGATMRIRGLNRNIGQASFADGYGMVELAGGVAVRFSPPFLDLPMLPMPPYKLKAVDDEGNEVPEGEVGELVVKGPGVLKGYHGNEAATKEILTEDGWLRTGDLARRRRFGLVSFAGRKKHVIKHGGYSVFAVEVETTLEEHPDVTEAAVIGIPDERKGEIPAAVVRIRPGSDLTPEKLVAWAKEQMSDYKYPRQVKIVDDLPRTGTDKVQKNDLAELFT